MDKPLSHLERNKSIRRVLLGILLANWSVAIAKLAYGVWSDAAAVTADGLHSFIDGSSNVLGLFAMSVAAQPADEDHPYGHGKFEALASLGVGVMVGVGMLELGRMAFDSLLHQHHPHVTVQMFAVMVLTLLVNLLSSRIEAVQGRKLNSSLLTADATHTLSDAVVSSAVLVSLGLVALGWTWADGAAALFIMGFVARVAYQIVKQAVGILSDSARLDPAKVVLLTSNVPGVHLCKDVRSRGMHESVYVDLKIEVDPSLPTAEAHDVAHAVERAITEAFPEIVDVVVHVEPATSADSLRAEERGSRALN